MTGPNKRVQRADTEAAAWHSRLGTTSVATATIEDFFAWHAIPENADAYRRVNEVWTRSRGLSADPELAQALEDARQRAARRRLGRVRRPGVIGGAVVVGCAVCVTVFGAIWWQGRGVYATQTGEQRVVELADGSTVKLDTATRMRVRFQGARRHVELIEGQALFTVTHDAARPFVVTAAGTDVVAVGTVFDVQRRGGNVDVTLVSGVVDVTAPTTPGGRTRLQAGQQARVSATAVRTRKIDTGTETAWARGRLVFEDVPLLEAVADINRYLPDKIVIDETALGSVRVNGAFRTGDRDAFVAAAEDVFGLKASPSPDGSIHLSRRQN